MRKSNLKREENSTIMIKPGITALSKCVDSRYTLVTMVAKRARMVGNDGEGLVPCNSKKAVSIAVEEVASGKVGYIRRERCYNEDTFYTEHIKDDAVNLDEVENLQDAEAETQED
jgi:DNA-directed RNA polymerase subunit omega